MGRGSRIEVPDNWLEFCERWRKEQGYSLREAGEAVAAAVEREQPFGASTMRRYLAGELVTDDLTRAFAAAMAVPTPTPVLEKPEHQLWCELGVRLDAIAPVVFARELQAIQRVVEAHENLARSRELHAPSHSGKKTD